MRAIFWHGNSLQDPNESLGPGYSPPECTRPSAYTMKSDVYSFGVVLVELLLRMKPIFTSTSGTIQNLSSYFLQEFREGRITGIVNSQILEEASEEEINNVASIAEACLRLRGAERPTMKQVEVKLQILRTKRTKLCQVDPINEEQMQSRLQTRRARVALQSSTMHLGDRIKLRSRDNQWYYGLHVLFSKNYITYVHVRVRGICLSTMLHVFIEFL